MDSINELTRDVESMIDRFETTRSGDPRTDLRDFVPPRDHRDYKRILVELVRADMEFSWEEGAPCGLAEYCTRFQELSSDKDAIAELAFEEYRLRFQHGDAVSPEVYAHELGVNTSGWPVWNTAADPAAKPLSREYAAVDRLVCESGGELNERGRFPAAGTQFGHFELVAELGSGTFARVYLARQPSLANRFVALKVTTSALDEAQRLAQLQHTNIVPIHSVHRIASFHVICMPYLGAATLADVVRGFDSLPESGEWFLSTVAGCRASTLAACSLASGEVLSEANEPETPGRRSLELIAGMSYQQAAVWLMARVAAGVFHAHQHGFVHGDLKPANILLSDDGEPLILDFNLSASTSSRGSGETVVGGTLPYMSPEQIEAVMANETVHAAADIFSFGVILYELLTGRLPFPCYEGPFERVASRTIGDRRKLPPPVRQINPSVSPDVESIILRCLQPYPDDRYRDAGHLSADLNWHLDDRPLQFAANRSPKERLRKWARRHPRVSSATGVALGALVIVAALSSFVAMKSFEAAKLRARQVTAESLDNLGAHSTALNTAFVNDHLAEAVEKATALLRQSQLDQLAVDRLPKEYRPASAADHTRLRRRVGEVQHLLAAAFFQESQGVLDTTERKTLLERALRRSKASAATFLDNQHPKALYVLEARILDQLGRSQQAEIARQHAEKTPLRGIEDHQLLAHERMLSHRHAEAVRLLEPALEGARSYFTGWFVLGAAYLRLSRFQDAESAFTACLSIDPDSAPALFWRGVARCKQAAFSKGLADFNRGIGLDADSAQFLVNRALVYKQMGRLREAERDLTRALELGATESRILFIRSRVRHELADHAGARLDREAGLRRTPTDELSWIARGMARRTDDPHGAIEDFEAALTVNPRSWRALQNLAEIHGHQPDGVARAIECLDRLLELEPDVPKWPATRGIFLSRVGRVDEAIRDAEAALELRRDADTLYRVAGIFAQTSPQVPQNADMALELLARAAVLEPALVVKYLPTDPDLRPLRNTAKFREFQQTLAKLYRHHPVSKVPGGG